ncbi:c-type cytochrome [Anianabacter salinae]|uniref:c-type cytochrome n=1 Tax=Anianabacter salinae TaxID=2851023 RepID=UPI00225DDFE1|nr:cytochrome c [Anianabacter salinae]MBV0912110.1 cytochrome c [Anianabacter salinae]
MTFTRKFVLTLTAGVVAASTAFAASHSGSAVPADAATKGRKAHMQVYAHNLGILGGMAQGNIPFDAALAQTAADNLHAVSALPQTTYWVPGTAVGEIDGSKALPAIWENMEDFEAKQVALTDAAAAMQAAAGSLEGVQGAMRGIGGACGACHEDYRQSD